MDVTKNVRRFSKRLYEKQQQAINESELTTELAKNNGTNLLDLDEDCLLEIFSIKSLTLMDLCSLAETCTHFQRIVRRVFPTKLEIDFNFSKSDKECVVTSTKNSIGRKEILQKGQEDDDIEMILKNCGSSLLGIKLLRTTKEKSSFLMNLVSKYCVESFECPDMNCMETTDVLTVKSKQISSRLQMLDLVYISDGFDSIAAFESLIELRVEFSGCEPILATMFPKLERFTFNNNYYNVDHSSLQTFISRHQKLKTLDISVFIAKRYRSEVLQGICDNCRKLEELSLHFGFSNDENFALLPLQALKRLTTLKLWYVSCKDLSLVPKMANLREMYLFCNYNLPNSQIVHLTELRKLHIFDLRGVDIVDLIKRLIYLEEFQFVIPELNEEIFSEIARIVNGRPHVLTLECYFDFSYNCDKNQKVRLLNP